MGFWGDIEGFLGGYFRDITEFWGIVVGILGILWGFGDYSVFGGF